MAFVNKDDLMGFRILPEELDSATSFAVLEAKVGDKGEDELPITLLMTPSAE